MIPLIEQYNSSIELFQLVKINNGMYYTCSMDGVAGLIDAHKTSVYVEGVTGVVQVED